MWTRSLLFCNVTQLCFVIIYRSFRTAQWFNLRESSRLQVPWRWDRRAVLKRHQSALRNTPEDRKSQSFPLILSASIYVSFTLHFLFSFYYFFFFSYLYSYFRKFQNILNKTNGQWSQFTHKLWASLFAVINSQRVWHANMRKRLHCHNYSQKLLNTLRTGEADLRFYITTVQDGWRKSAFLTRACFPCTIHLIM